MGSLTYRGGGAAPDDAETAHRCLTRSAAFPPRNDSVNRTSGVMAAVRDYYWCVWNDLILHLARQHNLQEASTQFLKLVHQGPHVCGQRHGRNGLFNVVSRAGCYPRTRHAIAPATSHGPPPDGGVPAHPPTMPHEASRHRHRKGKGRTRAGRRTRTSSPKNSAKHGGANA